MKITITDTNGHVTIHKNVDEIKSERGRGSASEMSPSERAKERWFKRMSYKEDHIYYVVLVKPNGVTEKIRRIDIADMKIEKEVSAD